jgi:hypothetical protein
MFRNLLIASKVSQQPASIYPLIDEPVNTATPYADEALTPFTPDSRFIIVGADTIDGDVRAGVYSILDKQTMTLVSDRVTNDANVSGGYSISWTANSQNVSCSTGASSEKMHLNILRNIQRRDIRISATINGNGVSNKTIYFDVNCTYAPANFVIRNISDWLLLKTAINEGQESYYYLNATTGCANKRFRLDCNLTFNYNTADYSIGFYDSENRSLERFFMGVFDGADNTITLSGTHPETATKRRNGGVFGNIRGAKIVNLNVTGSITSSIQVGGVVAIATYSTIERVKAKVQVISTTQQASLLLHSNATYYGDTTAKPGHKVTIKDVFVCGYAYAKKNTGGISAYSISNATRTISIGKLESMETAQNYAIRTAFSLTDTPKVNNPDLFVNGVFSKCILVNGDSRLRVCVHISDGTKPKNVTDILDLNQKAPYTGCISYWAGDSEPTLTRCYSLQTTQGGGAWVKANGINIADFETAKQNDYFPNNQNWIKGGVGTNIINNQYATDPDVLAAAKEESYYGGY